MIYTFECSCGATRQENISVEARDTTVVTCSTCNAAMRRIFNAGKVNIAMKGWGWTGRDTVTGPGSCLIIKVKKRILGTKYGTKLLQIMVLPPRRSTVT
jgi:predicted nucleic acid-binding Zn ribbon protein